MSNIEQLLSEKCATCLLIWFLPEGSDRVYLALPVARKGRIGYYEFTIAV